MNVASDCTSCDTEIGHGRVGPFTSGTAGWLITVEEMPDVFRSEVLSARGFDSRLVENSGNGCVIGMVVQRSLRYGHRPRIGVSSPDGSMNRWACSAFESNVSRDRLRAANQSDIFDQQPR